MAKPPRWRSELAAEIDAHQRIGMRPEHLAPQIAGLRCDLDHYLSEEPRMHARALELLAEAEEAIPYGRRPVVGYQATRAQLGRRGLAADVAPLEALWDRWHVPPMAAMTTVVWVVRQYIRIHARRHGALASPWDAGFEDRHASAVEDMQRTLLGSRPPERRYVQAWRRHA